MVHVFHLKVVLICLVSCTDHTSQPADNEGALFLYLTAGFHVCVFWLVKCLGLQSPVRGAVLFLSLLEPSKELHWSTSLMLERI